MIHALPPIAADAAAPVQDAAATPHRNAFDAAPHGAGTDAPDAIGHLVLDTLGDVQARAAHVRAAMETALSDPALGPAAPGTPAQADAASSGHAPGDDPAGAHRGAVAVMVEVFDFAVQSELVSRAATAFTGSVNTLIKTQ